MTFGKPVAKSGILGKSPIGFNLGSSASSRKSAAPTSRVSLLNDDDDDDNKDSNGYDRKAGGAQDLTGAEGSRHSGKSALSLYNPLKSTQPVESNGDVAQMDVDASAPADLPRGGKSALVDKESVPITSSTMDSADDGFDSLDAFMADVHDQVQQINKMDNASSDAVTSAVQATKTDSASPDIVMETGEGDRKQSAERLNDDEEEDDEEIDEDDENDNRDLDADEAAAIAAARLAIKKKDLVRVDHSTINYIPFRKNFYIEPPELASLTDEEVDQRRLDLDGIKIRGSNCPKPIEKWTQFGMPPGVHETITRVLKYERPSPIQCQAIPAIISGRDVIGIAKTGSGKTIAFLLPMFRHIKDQPELKAMDGPIALIMTPTRELAMQIHRECKHFTKALNLRAVCCYGGSPIKDQIADLKRGAEIIICTPGRMIDLLCANSGRVTNLRRVTYLVLDEADRMFDLGFEPQVMKMVNNIRPDRQTVLFSATFPRKMEALARKVLRKPLEITVGARSVVASDVTQHVEVHPDDESKFFRLLEILGLSSATDPDAKILIFVDRQEAADTMLSKLMRRGYPCQSLHGGKDQSDRDSTIADFKTGSTNILIATSVAARGLDVKQLKIVVNYECPNHLEDYVHRVGRTGRAGNKGTAYTFIMPSQDRYAMDISKALTMSGVEVPPDVKALCDGFMEKIKTGNAHYSSGGGFGGRGLEQLDKDRDMVKRIQKKTHGGELGLEDEDDATITPGLLADAEDAVKSAPVISHHTAAPLAEPATAAASVKRNTTVAATTSAAAAATTDAAPAVAEAPGAKLQQVLKKLQGSLRSKLEAGVSKNHTDAPFTCDIEINDYVQKARYRATNKETIRDIQEATSTTITTRGEFCDKGKTPAFGQRKLYLFVEGDTQKAIDEAKAMINDVLIEATMSSMGSDGSGSGSTRYTITAK
eukprot:jgi/Hompol1/6883/HPOL_000572-RA